MLFAGGKSVLQESDSVMKGTLRALLSSKQGHEVRASLTRQETAYDSDDEYFQDHGESSPSGQSPRLGPPESSRSTVPGPSAQATAPAQGTPPLVGPEASLTDGKSTGRFSMFTAKTIFRGAVGQVAALLSLPSLTVLSLRGNGLDQLPRWLPPSLQELYVSDNVLTELPEFVFLQLPHLRVLEAHNNRIATVSHALSAATQLVMLSLKYNPISEPGQAHAQAGGSGGVGDQHESPLQWITDFIYRFKSSIPASFSGRVPASLSLTRSASSRRQGPASRGVSPGTGGDDEDSGENTSDSDKEEPKECLFGPMDPDELPAEVSRVEAEASEYPNASLRTFDFGGPAAAAARLFGSSLPRSFFAVGNGEQHVAAGGPNGGAASIFMVGMAQNALRGNSLPRSPSVSGLSPRSPSSSRSPSKRIVPAQSPLDLAAAIGNVSNNLETQRSFRAGNARSASLRGGSLTRQATDGWPASPRQQPTGSSMWPTRSDSGI